MADEPFSLFYLPFRPALDANGIVVPGASLTFYLSGTNTLQAVYADAELTTPLANPLTANAAGKWPAIYIDTSLIYRVVLRGTLGETLESVDPYTPGMIGGPAGNTGPADNTYTTYADLLASDPSRKSARLVPQAGETEPAGNFSYIGGSWVRQRSDGIATRLPSVAAVVRSQDDKNADTVAVLDFYDPTDFDLTDALERVAYTAYDGSVAGQPLRRSIQCFLPNGQYGVSRQIVPWRQFSIVGESEAGTVLLVDNLKTINPVMKGVFSFGEISTLNAYAGSGAGKVKGDGTDFTNGAASSQMRDLQLKIGSNNVAGLCSVWSATLVTLRNVFSHRGGFVLEAGNLQFDSGRSVTGNCNLSRLERCTVLFAIQDGFRLDGSDANNISVSNCNSFQPTRYGYLDGSFLGNSYRGCHADGGVSGAKSVNPSSASRTSWIGCYVEPNTSGLPWDIATGNLIISPQGSIPDGRADGANTVFAPTAVAGMWANQSITTTAREADAFGIGDATHPAARYGTTGIQVRAPDGKLYGLMVGGDSVYLTRDGQNIMKLDRGAAIPDANAGNVVDVVNAILNRMRTSLPNIQPS